MVKEVADKIPELRRVYQPGSKRIHWYLEEDKGIRQVYIKPKSPHLNGKMERSHRTDQQEFFQLLSYTDDVDLNKKLEHWEHFHNLDRPHGAHDGESPYEALKCILDNTKLVQ